MGLHEEAMGWLRFGKRLPYVATEVGNFHADVVGADSDQLIEIEVKKSKSDLLRDFSTKPWKHLLYDGPGLAPSAWVPNIFYFLVPQELADWAKEQLDTKKTPAGLLVLNKASFSTGYIPRGNLVVKKRPKVLHSHKPTPATLRRLAERMANELTGLRVILAHRLPGEEGGANVQELLKAIHQLGETPDVVQAIDPCIPPDAGNRPREGDHHEPGVRARDASGTDGEVPPPPNCS